jgi:transposase
LEILGSFFTEEQMPTAYSLDLRTRVLNDRENGMSSNDVAKKYSIAVATVNSWRQQQRETGSIAPKKYKRGPKIKLAPYEKEVRQLVADHPDATLEELHAQLPNKDEVTVVTLHNFWKRVKIKWKKRLSMLPNSIEKTSSLNAKNGKSYKKSSTSKDSFSSTKHGRKRT